MIKPKRSLVISLFISFLVFLALIFKPLFLSTLRMKFVDALEFPLKVASSVLCEAKSVLYYKKILNDNLRLKKESEALAQKILTINEVERENDRLKKLVSFKNSSSYLTVAARIIAKESSNWGSVVIIDKGKSDKISVNDSVITEMGLVGKVLEAGASTSKVVLINDPNLNVPSLIQRSREQGVVSGTILGELRMRYLGLNSDVSAGDKVITSGLGSIFPKGILIGDVQDVRADSSGLIKLCIIKPAAELSKIEEVLIVIK